MIKSNKNKPSNSPHTVGTVGYSSSGPTVLAGYSGTGPITQSNGSSITASFTNNHRISDLILSQTNTDMIITMSLLDAWLESNPMSEIILLDDMTQPFFSNHFIDNIKVYTNKMLKLENRYFSIVSLKINDRISESYQRPIHSKWDSKKNTTHTVTSTPTYITGTHTIPIPPDSTLSYTTGNIGMSGMSNSSYQMNWMYEPTNDLSFYIKSLKTDKDIDVYLKANTINLFIKQSDLFRSMVVDSILHILPYSFNNLKKFNYIIDLNSVVLPKEVARNYILFTPERSLSFNRNAPLGHNYLPMLYLKDYFELNPKLKKQMYKRIHEYRESL